MSDQKTIPILFCGRKEEHIAGPVTEHLKPDIDVVYYVPIPSLEEAITNIRLLIAGQEPSTTPSTLGSANYTTPPAALVFGGGLPDKTIDEIWTAVRTSTTTRKVPALLPNKPKIMGSGVNPRGPEYPPHAAQWMREALVKLQGEGKLDGTDDGVYQW